MLTLIQLPHFIRPIRIHRIQTNDTNAIWVELSHSLAESSFFRMLVEEQGGLAEDLLLGVGFGDSFLLDQEVDVILINLLLRLNINTHRLNLIIHSHRHHTSSSRLLSEPPSQNKSLLSPRDGHLIGQLHLVVLFATTLDEADSGEAGCEDNENNNTYRKKRQYIPRHTRSFHLISTPLPRQYLNISIISLLSLSYDSGISLPRSFFQSDVQSFFHVNSLLFFQVFGVFRFCVGFFQLLNLLIPRQFFLCLLRSPLILSHVPLITEFRSILLLLSLSLFSSPIFANRLRPFGLRLRLYSFLPLFFPLLSRTQPLITIICDFLDKVIYFTEIELPPG